MEQLEAAVSALPGIASCTVTRLPPAAPGASGDAFGDDGSNGHPYNHGAPLHLLVAKRIPAAAQQRHAASSSGRPQAEPSPTGSSRKAAAGGAADDAVWEALEAGYDASGRRRRSGLREVLETVRGLGYGGRVASGGSGGGGGGGASAMEASQVRFMLGMGESGLKSFFARELRRGLATTAGCGACSP